MLAPFSVIFVGRLVGFLGQVFRKTVGGMFDFLWLPFSALCRNRACYEDVKIHWSTPKICLNCLGLEPWSVQRLIDGKCTYI